MQRDLPSSVNVEVAGHKQPLQRPPADAARAKEVAIAATFEPRKPAGEAVATFYLDMNCKGEHTFRAVDGHTSDKGSAQGAE